MISFKGRTKKDIFLNGYGASSAVQGRLGASFGASTTRFWYQTEALRLGAILYSNLIRFKWDFCFIRTRGKALRYYKNRSFKPAGDFQRKLFQDPMLVPNCANFASQNPPKSRLRGVLGRLGAVLGLSWALWARLRGVLERLKAL